MSGRLGFQLWGSWLPLGAVIVACGSVTPNDGDLAVPRVVGTVSTIDGYPVFVPGETFHVTVSATDDFELAYFGFSLGGGAAVHDSAAAHGRSGFRDLTFVAQPEWAGPIPFSVFVRDAAGKTDTTLVDTILVVLAERRPMTHVALPAAPFDLAWDSVRNRAYLSLPSINQIAVLDLTTGTLLPPIDLFGVPLGLDLSPGGDSLVAALRQRQSLAFVDLINGAVDTARLGIAPNEGPIHLRVLANNKAVVTIGFDGSGAGASARIVDLTGGGDMLVPGPPMAGGAVARSADRNYLLLIDDGICCNFPTRIYRTATDSFGPAKPTTNYFAATSSIDRNGTRFLVGRSVFDADLRLLVTIEPPGVWYEAATVLTGDGGAAFVTGPRTFVRARVPSSAVEQRVLVPLPPERLALSPDNATLLAITTDPKTGGWSLWLIPQ
jgi:hypothetical protein